MRARSCAIIIKNDKILFIHRFKSDKPFFVLPGGGIKKEETPLEASIREAKEETGLKVKDGGLIFKFKNPYNQQSEYYFLFHNPSGKLGTSENLELKWLSLRAFENKTIYPEKIQKIIKNILTSKI